jgi:hypothetical protein
MALLSGFPVVWTDCLLESNPKPKNTDLEVATSLGEQLSPSRQQSLLSESNTSIRLFPGKQWIDPKLVQLKEGTQPRDCDESFAGEMGKIQQYADDMKSRIWDFEKKPLPVAFIDAAGKIHASDCHHRVSAAVSAGIEKIYVDLRFGELVDAKLFAVAANTDHGLPLRPKDQRKRVEMLLNLLETVDEDKATELLNSIPDLGRFQRENSLNHFAKDKTWTARTVAKYLKMNESGYRTVQNIMLERRRLKSFNDFNMNDFTRVMGGDFDWEGKIQSFDKRKGVFVIPLPWTVGNDGRMLNNQWVEPWDLKKVSPTEADKLAAALQRSNQRSKEENPVFTSVKEEQKHKAKELGIPDEGLPDMGSNEGDPTSLVENHKAIRIIPTIDSLLCAIDQLEDRDLYILQDLINKKIVERSIKGWKQGQHSA